MSRGSESLADRFYRGLLRILPIDFRSEFGDEMEVAFREQRAETVRRKGAMGVFRMWGATIADIRRAHSHSVALGQVRRILRELNLTPVVEADTR